MIAAWMVYSVVVGILIVSVAMVVEHIALTRGGETRRVWAWALVAAMALPAAGVIVRDAPPATELNGSVVATSPMAGVVMEGVQTLASFDGVLVQVWAAATILLAALLAGGLATMWRRRIGWSSEDVDNVPVLVSSDVGPAVVGILRSRIVLPAWAMEADATERSMMLRHEQEHVSVGDPRLLLFGAFIIVVLPWNPAVWFMVRRVRLAIEVDCDRRVVRSGDFDLRRYAELLLAVGTRRSAPAFGVGFSVGRPFLEQRIDRMTLPRSDSRRVGATLLLVSALCVLAAAWALPQPVRAAYVSYEWCEGEQVEGEPAATRSGRME